MQKAQEVKKIDHKTLSHSFHLWFWGALTCFSGTYADFRLHGFYVADH